MKPKKTSTKQRIVDTALKLFNERRYSNVTTAILAREVGIAEGNLWYHFNDKASLLEALGDKFNAHIETRLTYVADEGDALERYIAFFKVMALEISEFRFFFRDQADYGASLSSFMVRVPRLYRRTAAQYRSYFDAMREEGYIVDMSDEKVAAVVANLIILFRYYMEFAHEADLPEKDGAGAVARAFSLHLFMFCDHLTPSALSRLRREFFIEELPDQIL